MSAVPAVAGAALAGLLGVAAAASPLLLVLAVSVVVLAVASGWPRLLRLPSPRGSRAVLAAVGGVAVGVAAASQEPPLLAPLAGVVALGVLGEFVHQMLRTDGRPRLVESVTGTTAGQAVAVMSTGWLVLPEAVPQGDEVVVVGAAAAAATSLACAVPLPPRLQWALALPLAAAAAALAASLTSPLQALGGAGLGLAVAVTAAALHSLLVAQPTARSQPAVLALAAAPLAASGISAYVVARLVLG